MADLSYSGTSRSYVGGKQFVKTVASFESVGSYPEGGQPVVAETLGLHAIELCVALGNPSIVYSDSLHTLQVFVDALADGSVAADAVTNLGVNVAEMAPGGDPSAINVVLFIIGY